MNKILKKEFLKTQKGITLIALVITIIVLLILSGVSINLLSGGDGILKKATNAVDTSNEEKAQEQVKLKLAEFQTEYYDEMYVKKNISVNTEMGDWIAENKTGEINTEDYTFTITGSSPYTVTIKKDNTIKEDIVGSLGEDGKLEWASSGSGGSGSEGTTPGNPDTPENPGGGTPGEPETPSIPEGLEIGSEVTYTPSGTYTEWTGEHSGNSSYNYSLASGSSYTDSSTQTDMTITNWKVFKIDEATGEVQLVPSNPTTNRVGLKGATGYNNAVKLLNEACSSLYGNGSKNITARSINMEDIESVLEYDPTTYKDTSENVTYGQQYSDVCIMNKKYPNIYASEEKNVIDGTESAGTLGRSDAASNWISGYATAGTSIQPYQTYYYLNDSDFSSKLKTEENGIKYSDLLLPNTTSTNYWVASRCVSLFKNICRFAVRYVVYGRLDAHWAFLSSDSAGGVPLSLFPVVSLSSGLLEGDATIGFSVK